MDIIMATKVAQASSFINYLERYKWIISNTNLDIAKELRLTNIKNY